MNEKLIKRFDQRYTKSVAAFGEEPDEILTKFYHLIDNSAPILDVGAGQGRNSFFLAEKGYGVEALEPSEVGIKQMEAVAAKEGWPIHLTQGDLASFEKKCEHYSAVLLSGIIQLLDQPQLEKLIVDLKDWTTAGSIIFVTAFSVNELSFDKHKKEDEELSPNCFKSKDGFIRHYLEENEILTLFKDYEVIHHREYITEPHHHGDGNMHQHAKIEAVLKVL